jgi:large subunit ribosomal protein L6
MSRIGKQPILVPAGVNIDIVGQHVTVKGKKGQLEMDVLDDIVVVIEDNTINVDTLVDSKRVNAFRGLTRSLINNMVIGVDKGFSRNLIIEGVGYKASVQGNELTLNVGYSNAVIFKVPAGVDAAVEGSKIILNAIDKDILGLTAAKIRQIRKPEPYKGKGIRYEDEHIVRKVGKSGASKK